MANEQALVPIEQKTVDFYEDQVTAVRLTSGVIALPAAEVY